MTDAPATAAASVEYDGTTYWFCDPGCRDAFVAEPDGSPAAATDRR